MTNNLDRRIAKIEAAARTSDGDGAVRVAFVRPGEDQDEQVAKLGPIKRGDRDHLIVVRFVRPADIQSPRTLQ